MRIRRIVTLALAFMLVISCLPVSALTTSEDFHSRYVRSHDYHSFPVGIFEEEIAVINTQEELIQTGFTPRLTGLYSDAFFQTHYLVIVSRWEPSGAHRHHVERVDENGVITIQRLIRAGSDDMAAWHIVIELCRSFRPESFEAVFTPSPFHDVPAGHWVRPYVQEAYERGIVVRDFYTCYSFFPHEAATRAMAVDFIWRAAGAQTPTSTVSPFPDVDSNDWFFEAVLWTVENNIIRGRPDGTFAPNDTLERRELAVMLMRFAEYFGVDIWNPPPHTWPFFVDYTGWWAEHYIRWNFAVGLLRGDDNRMVHAERETERAEAVATVVRFVNRFVD